MEVDRGTLERGMRVLCFWETKNDEDIAKKKVHEDEKRKTATVWTYLIALQGQNLF